MGNDIVWIALGGVAVVASTLTIRKQQKDVLTDSERVEESLNDLIRKVRGDGNR